MSKITEEGDVISRTADTAVIGMVSAARFVVPLVAVVGLYKIGMTTEVFSFLAGIPLPWFLYYQLRK